MALRYVDIPCIRDYIHVEDIAHAHASPELVARGTTGVHVLNLGSVRDAAFWKLFKPLKRLAEN